MISKHIPHFADGPFRSIITRSGLRFHVALMLSRGFGADPPREDVHTV